MGTLRSVSGIVDLALPETRKMPKIVDYASIPVSDSSLFQTERLDSPKELKENYEGELH